MNRTLFVLGALVVVLACGGSGQGEVEHYLSEAALDHQLSVVVRRCKSSGDQGVRCHVTGDPNQLVGFLRMFDAHPGPLKARQVKSCLSDGKWGRRGVANKDVELFDLSTQPANPLGLQAVRAYRAGGRAVCIELQ